MSKYNSIEMWSAEWAEDNANVHCFDLDIERSWNNLFVQPIVVPNIISNGERVDMLSIEMRVVDIGDVLDVKYKARLEVDGKGVFITMPRVPKLFFNQIDNLYSGTSMEDDPQYAAHSIQAVEIVRSELKQQRIVYFQFPDEITCDNSHFNEKVTRSPTELQLKLAKPVLRSLPGVMFEGQGEDHPKFQYIPGVKWECAIATSVKEVTNKQRDEDDMLSMLLATGVARMDLAPDPPASDKFTKGGPKGPPQDPPPKGPPRGGGGGGGGGRPEQALIPLPPVPDTPLLPHVPDTPLLPPVPTGKLMNKKAIKERPERTNPKVRTNEQISNEASNRAVNQTEQVRQKRKAEILAQRRHAASPVDRAVYYREQQKAAKEGKGYYDEWMDNNPPPE
eukprot:CAMPEP_0172407986 /NCGR_PEP_ID=MMETSP1061-20121228/75624_1 /TAXON_ID=37318 /ORGANISM="Pseudo-nitzschia pungens, Strain cf. pungens" /LENGTH=391 /DNA_ID=CAMNT_0013144103 /DNA_START=451 /DNA_END=1626 /DNA_ORIENTATION=-